MTASLRLLTAFFTFAGIMHFVIPRSYEATMPPYIPIDPKPAVQISGVAEIAGALLVIAPATRSLGRWWLLALLVAVFPANVYMATDPEKIKEPRPRPDAAVGVVGAAAAPAADDVVGVARDSRHVSVGPTDPILPRSSRGTPRAC